MPTPTQRINPLTGRKVYAKKRTSDGVILSTNATWPTSIDDEPIAGDDGSFVFLPIVEDANDTVYDSELFSVVTVNLVEPTRYYVTRTITQRPAEELKTRAKNHASINNNSLVPIADLADPLAITLNAVMRELKGLTLTPLEIIAKAEVAERASGLLANKARLAEINTAIDANVAVDLKAGWTKKASVLP